MTKQCLFYFAGREADGGGSFPLTAGVTPSLAVIRFRLSYTYNQIGSLLLTDSVTQREFRNCRLLRAVIQPGQGGARWRELQIYDRRWAWAEQYGGVYGAYNLDTRSLGDPRNRKTARELATLLCEAMGETGYDVSAMPSTVYPRVDWFGQNPASELEQLAKLYRCFITLTPQDTLLICREGLGETPSNDPRQMDFTYSEELPVIPKALCFEGADLLCQHDLKLAPVGMETTGASKGRLIPIDNLSYTPSGGWAKQKPDNFQKVADLNDRAMAKQYIWRYYQITGPIQLPIPTDDFLPRNGSGKVDPSTPKAVKADFLIAAGDEWRLLPLEEDQLQCFKDAVTNEALKPQVIGYFATGGPGINNYTTLPAEATNYDVPIASVPLPKASHGLLYGDSFEVDSERGLVVFTNPVYRWSKTADAVDDSAYLPARIRLRCAFPVRAKANAGKLTSQYWQSPGSPVSVGIVKKVRNSELGFEYGLKTVNDAAALTSNASDFLVLASGVLQQEMATYAISRGYSSPWKGFIFDKKLDGVIRSIVWDVSDDGQGTTTIDYNMERPEAYLSLDYMRLARYQTASLVRAQQLAAAELRRNRKS